MNRISSLVGAGAMLAASACSGDDPLEAKTHFREAVLSSAEKSDSVVEEMSNAYELEVGAAVEERLFEGHPDPSNRLLTLLQRVEIRDGRKAPEILKDRSPLDEIGVLKKRMLLDCWLDRNCSPGQMRALEEDIMDRRNQQ